MTDTRIHTHLPGNLFPLALNGRHSTPLLVALVILGMIGLGAAACGIAGIGAHHHIWSAGLLDQLNQTYSIVLTVVGGVVGLGCVLAIALAKTCQHRAQHLKPHIEEISGETPQTEQQGQPTALSSTEPIKTKKKSATNRTAQMCITTQTGGYIGDPTRRQFLPHYLEEMTLKDGSALPLDADDFFVEVYLFNVSRQLTAIGIPTTLFLPGELLRNKNDGDVVRLRYKGKLIELAIEQQNHGLKFAKGTFEDVFASVATYIQACCDRENPLFSLYDPFWMYKLGKGKLYKLEGTKKNDDLTICTLKEGVPSDFRAKKQPETPPYDILLSDDETKLIFVIEVPRLQTQDFNIIVNEKHLIFYGRFDNRPLLPDLPDLPDLKRSREVMFSYRWDRWSRFQTTSLQEMQDLVMKSQSCLSRGILQFEIPLPM